MAESRIGTAIDSALAVRGARLGVLLLVPFLSAGGWVIATYFDHQSKALQHLADGQEKTQQAISTVSGNVGVLSYKLDDQSRRIDQQGEWLKGQGADIKDLQRQVYPLVAPRRP